MCKAICCGQTLSLNKSNQDPPVCKLSTFEPRFLSLLNKQIVSLQYYPQQTQPRSSLNIPIYILVPWYMTNTPRRGSYITMQWVQNLGPSGKKLTSEGLKSSTWGIAKFLKHYKTHGTLSHKPGSGRTSKIVEVQEVVEQQIRKDDDTTAEQLHVLLTTKGYKLSIRTVLRCRTSLGWTFRGSSYCQLIRTVNKEKRLAWAKENFDKNFCNIIWTDECTVQLETHRRFCCRKKGEPPKNKPR